MQEEPELIRGISWDKSLEVGDPIIDAQHRHLVDLINALQAAGDGEGLKTADTVLYHILRFLRHHFETEELLFAEIPYEGSAEHIAEHHRMLAHVSQVVEEAGRGRGGDTKPFALQIWSWVHQHTLTWDRSFIPALRLRHQSATTILK